MMSTPTAKSFRNGCNLFQTSSSRQPWIFRQSRSTKAKTILRVPLQLKKKFPAGCQQVASRLLASCLYDIPTPTVKVHRNSNPVFAHNNHPPPTDAVAVPPRRRPRRRQPPPPAASKRSPRPALSPSPIGAAPHRPWPPNKIINRHRCRSHRQSRPPACPPCQQQIPPICRCTLALSLVYPGSSSRRVAWHHILALAAGDTMHGFARSNLRRRRPARLSMSPSRPFAAGESAFIPIAKRGIRLERRSLGLTLSASSHSSGPGRSHNYRR